jgi:hypothetical protein
VAGPTGPSGLSDVDAPLADTAQSNAATFAFGGEQRAAIGQQPQNPLFCCIVPGSGTIDVESGTGRTTQLTHYRYGSTLRSTGPGSNIFEFFLGSVGTGQPQLSVRSNGFPAGASVQARNAQDTSGFILDFGQDLRPSLHTEDHGRDANSVLAIENPQPGGSIVLATGTGTGTGHPSQLRDNLTLSADGVLTAIGDVVFGDAPQDRVRFHGTSGSGEQGEDPGALLEVAPEDVDTPEELAARLNEQRKAINALRQALVAQGLIG